jgi:DNA-binding transcriptional MerR regulator
MTIYELGDIARITGIPKSRVKNWTIGRPFTVKPSVRRSSGKGSRNLFSHNDLYVFDLVQRLSDIGAPVAGIQNLLEKQDMSDDWFWKDQNWVLITRKGTSFGYEINLAEEYNGNFPLNPENDIVCFYAVNMKTILESVSRGLASAGLLTVVGRASSQSPRAESRVAEGIKGGSRARTKKAPTKRRNWKK